MATTQPTPSADELDMRALLDDTMTRLGVKAPTPAVATPTSTPAPDSQPKPPISRREQLLGAILGLILLIIVSILWSRWQAAAPAVPTTAPAQAIPTAAPPLPTVPLVAMLPAYGAPNEAPRWQIEATRVITSVAHFGETWIQADVAGSGLVWLRTSDFPALAIVGPDLAPKAVVAPQRAVDTPEPEPPCATAGLGNQQVTVCGWEGDAALQAAAAAKWAAQYGGHVGAGDIHPSPQPWERQDAIQNHLANEHTPTEETTP